ncbi:MAG TPA: hypothetical protein VGQ75_03090 [Thermoanaerobaculia bacterium]|jgi:hypothetical protein|nr:hypothetical protein [Thermoanaerobaculia bacterium]
MRRDVALAGGAALAAGLVLGFVVDRFRRVPQLLPVLRSASLRARSSEPVPAREEIPTDLLERYRAAAAI